MKLWFTKQADGFLAWFALEDKNGSLATGFAAGAFTVTVVDPTDSATNSPAVSESAQKAGLYMFTVPSLFITTNGVGGYGVVVEVDGGSGQGEVKGTFSAILKASVEDFDTLVSPAVRVSVISDDATPNNLEFLAWLERRGEPITSGLVSATIRLLEPDGTVVVPTTAMTLNATTGVFRASVASVTLLDVTNYYADVTVTDATGGVRAYKASPTLT